MAMTAAQVEVGFQSSYGRSATKAEQSYWQAKTQDYFKTKLGDAANTYTYDTAAKKWVPKAAPAAAAAPASVVGTDTRELPVANPGDSFGIPNQDTYNGITTRAGVEALGGQYLGTPEGVKAAQEAKKDLINVRGHIFVKPPAPVATGNEYRQEQQQGNGQGGVTPFATGAGTMPGVSDLKAPEPISMVDTYNKLSAEYNIGNLSAHLNALDQELAQYDTNYQAGTIQNKNALSPMELIQGKNRELYDQYQLGRQTLLNERNAIAAEVQGVQQTIATLVQLTGQDYQNSVTAYNNAFNQNMQLQQFYAQRADRAEDKAQEAIDRASNAARANLSTLTSAITASGKSWSSLDPSMKANIENLEVQSGLPKGTIQNFVAVKPKAELLASVNGVDASGNDIVTLIYKDANGMPGTIKTIKTGGVTKPKGSGSGSGGSLDLQTATDYVANIIQGRLTLKDVGQDERNSVATIYNKFLATTVGKNISSYISSLKGGAESWNGISTREQLIDNIVKNDPKKPSRQQIADTVYNFIPDDFETGLKAANANKSSGGVTVVVPSQ